MYAFRQKVKDFANRFKTVCEFLILDIKRRPGTFKIGLFTIYIVIVFLVLLQSILQLTPILFLSIAEGQSGMVDLELTPLVKNFTKQENFGMNMTLNITEIKGKIGNLTNIAALSSRWTFPINVSDPNNQTQNYRAIGIILDSQYERNNGIGANLNLKDLEDGECWISETLINLMQLSGIGFFRKLNLFFSN